MSVHWPSDWSPDAPVLEARGLVKSYDGRRVVDGLDLTLEASSVLGLLGPNGAGKTTTLRMLYGFIEPEAGQIRYGGLPFRRHRTRIKRFIGVCTQDDTLDEDFTVRQNLHVYATYFRPLVPDLESRVEALLDTFGLRSHAHLSPMALSGGFKRRLLIARSVVHRPLILFLDEPTTGLDPRARFDTWELIDQLRKEGMAIILTTHYMEEAERLSDRLLVMSNGLSVAAGKPRDLLGELLGEHVLVIAPDAPRRAEVLDWLERRLRAQKRAILGEVHVPVSAAQLAELSSAFEDVRLQVRPPTLDDLFIKLSVDVDGPPAGPRADLHTEAAP